MFREITIPERSRTGCLRNDQGMNISSLA